MDPNKEQTIGEQQQTIEEQQQTIEEQQQTIGEQQTSEEQKQKRDEKIKKLKELKKKQKEKNKEFDKLSQQYEAPPYTLNYSLFKNVIRSRVTLHRIPEQYINFDSTSTHFHVDTLKWTKKLFLHVPYPEGIKCNAKDVEAKLEYGVLTADIPVKQLPQHLQAEREKQLKLKGSKKDDLKTIVQNIKKHSQKRKADLNKAQQKKRKREANGADEKPTAEDHSAESETQTSKKKKKMPDKVETLRILANVATAQDKELQKKLNKNEQKDKALKKQEEKRNTRREKKRKVKQDLRKDVVSKLKNPPIKAPKHSGPTTNKKPPKRRVSFEL